MKLEKLGNICRIRNGYAFKSDKFTDEGVAIIRISDIQANFVTTDKSVRTPFHPVFENYRIKKGDILIAMSGATTGKFGIYDSDEIAFQNQRVGMFEINNHQVLKSQYLFQALKLVKPQIEKKAYGGGQPNISAANIGELKIPLPSISDQLHIANLLSKAENLISQRKQSIALLDDFLKSTFLEMFGDPVRNEKGWKLKLLSEYGKSRLGKMLDAKQIIGNNLKPYLRNSNLQWFSFKLDGLLEMDFDEKDKKEFSLKYGDILMCEGGEIGRCAIWKNQLQDCYFQKAIHRIRVNKEFVLPEFFVYMFWLYTSNGGLKKYMGAATISHLTGENLKNLKLPIPPIKLQTQFAQIVEKTGVLKAQYQSSLQELESLYGSISQRAFRGELTLNNAEEQVLMAAEPEAGYQAYKKK